MKLSFEEEDLIERQECSPLTSSNLKRKALDCLMARKQYQRDTVETVFEILLNRFGPLNCFGSAGTSSDGALRKT